MGDGKISFGKVLLIEDEAAHALLIKRALSPLCEEVFPVESVASGINALSSGVFDLVITDLQLPDSKGTGHIAALTNAFPDLPILVLTSSTSLRDAVEAMQLGARDFLVKDFGPEFKEVVSLALNRLAKSREIELERRKLQREMEVLRQALENSDDALGIINAAGRFEYANSAMHKFSALCKGSLESLSSLFTDDLKNAPALRSDLNEKFENLPEGAFWSTEVTLAGKDFRAFDAALSVVSRGQGAAASRQVVLWVRDITETKRREKFQREILSTTTHDLKGPLGAISISAELLREVTEAGSKPFELSMRIEAAAQGALSLIDEFLSARRLKEGSFVLKPAPCLLSAVLEEALANVEAIAHSRKIKLERGFPPELSAKVDRLGIQRVVGNLLSNAMKFTPAGGAVAVGASSTADGILIEVSDTGSGMQPADVQRLFNRFSRLDQHKDIAGTGLGLFVVKSIVSAHGGKVEVTSQPQRGSVFKVFLPAEPPVNERGELIALDFA